MAEVGATGRRHEAEQPIPVTALVPFRVQYDDVRELGADVEAEAIGWTDGAVLIRFRDATGQHHLWVYGAAVKRRS